MMAVRFRAPLQTETDMTGHHSHVGPTELWEDLTGLLSLEGLPKLEQTY
jgi:hypothetical protein